MNAAPIEGLIKAHLGKTFPAAQVEIRVGSRILYAGAFGFLDGETKVHPTNDQTLFDLASVSKLFTSTAFMTLVQARRVTLDQPVATILSEFNGERPITSYPDPLNPGQIIHTVPPSDQLVDAIQVTFRHLLAHNSGLPAWLGLWKMKSYDEMRAAVLNTSFAYSIGTRVVYSDLGFILLGFALEKIAGKSLRETVSERVTSPLGLNSVRYGKINCENVAPTEFYSHQGRRMCGEVHDENAWALGQVAGHAGLFARVHDVATLGQVFLCGGEPLLHCSTITEITQLQAEDALIRRGLGFALWSPDPLASSHPLSEGAFGHLGFTGTSLWVDPGREMVVACLTNRVYYGHQNADAITQFRRDLHAIACEVVDG